MKNKILYLIILSCLSPQLNAFRIYNNTGYDLNFFLQNKWLTTRQLITLESYEITKNFPPEYFNNERQVSEKYKSLDLYIPSKGISLRIDINKEYSDLEKPEEILVVSLDKDNKIIVQQIKLDIKELISKQIATKLFETKEAKEEQKKQVEELPIPGPKKS